MQNNLKKCYKVYLNGDYYDDMSYVKDKKIYQGQFGYLPLEAVLKTLNGEIDWIKLIPKEERGNDKNV